MLEHASTFEHDLQAAEPDVRLALTRAGVTGVEKVIRIAHSGTELLYYAAIDCYVDLDPDQKGVHMSRFPETVAEAIDQVVIGEALHVEDLAQHIAERIVERQQAIRSEVMIRAKFPITRRSPVSNMPTQEIYHLIGHALANGAGPRRMVGVEVRGLNACPCAQGLVRERARERLAEAGYDHGQIDEIFALLPAATHNQRAEATLMVGTTREIDARDLIQIAEHSMSAPVFELLKRPDELFVVEHAHLHPRFVEDSVRLMIAGALDRYPDLSDRCFLLARQVNHETIHNHDVLAERHGVVAELRADLEGRPPAPTHTTARDWLER
ncbi:MAG TPA: GTP cyclohydrolase MptA [Gaiellales bacterium]|jgi:GTP cyclohydrolase I/GTP cyclohydrolase-4|nr:GTP cyclohydrolase MptA [Gaiellales bacterium]